MDIELDKPRKRYEVILLMKCERYYQESYRVDAYSKAHAIWLMLDWIQRHTDMGWKDFEFTAVKEIGGWR